MTLDGLETELKAQFPRHKGQKVHLVRFADDFIVTGSNPELLEQEIKPLIERFLRERGLQLSPEKTRITHIETGFDFLGQNIRKYDNQLVSSQYFGGRDNLRRSRDTNRMESWHLLPNHLGQIR